jgi:hypothetical protein
VIIFDKPTNGSKPEVLSTEAAVLISNTLRDADLAVYKGLGVGGLSCAPLLHFLAVDSNDRSFSGLGGGLSSTLTALFHICLRLQRR